jgi:predicted DNA-binding transcriptional regulator AlpA
MPRLLSEQQVEQFYGLRVRTLQRWRLESRGPRYRKLHGLVRYDVRDLDAWIAAAPGGGSVNQ